MLSVVFFIFRCRGAALVRVGLAKNICNRENALVYLSGEELKKRETKSLKTLTAARQVRNLSSSLLPESGHKKNRPDYHRFVVFIVFIVFYRKCVEKQERVVPTSKNKWFL
jgi:hypothetical protein